MANTNPGYVTGQIPSAARWNLTYTEKVDATGGVLTDGILNGGTFNGSIGGSPTLAGIWSFAAAVSMASTLSVAGVTTIGGAGNAALTITPGATTANSVRLTTNGIAVGIGAVANNAFTWAPGAAAANTATMTTTGANGIMQLTSGGNINLTAQGTAPVVNIGSALGALASGRHKISFAGTGGTGGAYTGVDTAQYFTTSFSGIPQVIGATAPQASYMAVNSDTAAIGTGNHGSTLLLNQNFGGAAMTGGRVGVDINSVFTATSGNVGIAYNPFYVSLYAGMSIRAGDGGASHNDPRGGFFALNPQITAATGATFMGMVGMELNVAAQTGSQPTTKIGLQIIKTSDDAVDSNYGGKAIVVTDQVDASVGWRAIYQVGGIASQWPLAATGTIIFADLGQNYLTHPSSAKRGLDLQRASFTDYFLIGPNGFSVTGSAKGQFGTGYLRPVATGLELDVSGSVATAAAIASGGASFDGTNPRTQTATDTMGGVYTIDTIAAGAVTVLTMYRAPYVDGATPANPVALTIDPGFPGTGLTVNLTWSTRNELRIQPTAAGKMGFNGATPIVKPTGVAVTAAGIHAALVSLGLIAA